MRILQIASGDFFSNYGGGQVYVKNIVDTLIDLHKDISIISNLDKTDLGIKEKEYRGKKLIEISGIEYLEEAILIVKPDVIHAHSMKAEVCKIGKKLNIPIVVTSHHGGILCPAGTLLNSKDCICNSKINHTDCLPCVLRNIRTGLKLWYPFMRHLSEKNYISLGQKLKDKRFIPFITPIGSAAYHIQNKKNEWSYIARNCSIMIAPCDEIAESMIRNGIDKSKVKVIPHGIPLPESRPDYPPVINGKIKFYYVGRICYVKGIHVLLEAFKAVENSKIELHLIGGAGNKHEAQYMSDLRKKYKEDKRIIWHGKIAPENIFNETKNFHISISPSICLEAFGLNIAESLALGKPVLATLSGGGEMQIKDGINGWLVPANNVTTLSNKIEYITNNPGILSAMSSNCNAISIEEHCQQLYDVYEEVYKN